MKRLEKRLDLGLSVLVSRPIFQRSRSRLGLGKSWWVSLSSRTENQMSWSRLGLEAQGLVYIQCTSVKFDMYISKIIPVVLVLETRDEFNLAVGLLLCFA
jgi:hypothetical protein